FAPLRRPVPAVAGRRGAHHRVGPGGRHPRGEGNAAASARLSRFSSDCLIPRDWVSPRSCYRNWRGRAMRWLGGRWVDLVWLLVFGVASSAWCLTAAARLGATFDEPFYVKAGLVSWRTGSNKLLMRAGTMTLPVDVQTLPIYLWEQVRGQEFDPETELHTVLPLARATNLVFWWLLLAYAMRLGRTFGGAWGGRLAVALVACDPNLLGHAALATTDIALVACMMVLVYHFCHYYRPEAGWKRRVLVRGLLY